MIKEKYRDINLIRKSEAFKTINCKSPQTPTVQEVAETILNKRINNKLLG